MIRGQDFYAIWNDNEKCWSTDENEAIRLIDNELDTYYKENFKGDLGIVKVMHAWDSDTGVIDKWHKYCQKQMRDSFHMLDEKLMFANSEFSKNEPISFGRKMAFSLSAEVWARKNAVPLGKAETKFYHFPNFLLWNGMPYTRSKIANEC